MTETIIKGTGNSRLLKSVPNLRSLIPAGGDIIDLLIGSGLPVDVSGLQAAGVQTSGTPYSKATCLPDSVEQAIWGSAANRNIGQALRQLRNLITTAQGVAEGRLRAQSGTYVGTYDIDTTRESPRPTKTLTFSLDPAVVVVMPNLHNISTQHPTLSPLLMLQGIDMVEMPYRDNSYVHYSVINVSFGTKAVTWDSMVASGYNYLNLSFNALGVKYNWLAIG